MRAQARPQTQGRVGAHPHSSVTPDEDDNGRFYVYEGRGAPLAGEGQQASYLEAPT